MKILLSSICGALFFLNPAIADEVRHVDAKSAVQILQQEGKPVILDVRTAKEFAEEHIPGALNIDLNQSDFEEKLSGLEKSSTYLVHCRSGSRSKKSLDTFRKLGFQKIIHLDGGIKAWKKAGGPTVE